MMTSVAHVIQSRGRWAGLGERRTVGPILCAFVACFAGLAATAIPATAAESDDLVSMEVRADHDAVYPTQPFTVTLSVAVKALPGRLADRNPVSVQSTPPALEIPWANDDELPNALEPAEDAPHWLGALRDPRGSGFGINDLADRSVFSIFEDRSLAFQPRPKRVSRKGAQGAEAEYWVYDFSRTFTAKRPGRYSFGPVRLRGQFAAGADARGDLTGKNVRETAGPLVVEVKQVPETGRPDCYLGAVGRSYEWSAELSPTEARVGDPVTLTLTLRARGSLDGVLAPELARVPAVAENFKTYEATQQTTGGECRFTYTLRPLTEGITEFPAIPGAYFDVDTQKYVTLQTDPIPLKITAADRLHDSQIVGGSGAARTAKALEVRQEGIFANIADPAEVRNQRVRPEFWLIALGAMIGAYAVAAVGTWRYRRAHQDKSLERRRTAVARAKRRLRRGAARLKAREIREGADEVKAAMLGLVADVVDVPEAGLTSTDACRRLGALGVDADLVTRLGRSLDTCDAARYGLGDGGVNGLAGEITLLFHETVRSLKRQKRFR